MRTSTTKYITRAGLCAMALVLAAALVLAGCKQEADPPARQETQLEKEIKALAGKGAGPHTVTATGTLTNDDIHYVREALLSLPAGVMVNLNLSNVTGLTNLSGIRSFIIVNNENRSPYTGFDDCKALAEISLPNTITGYLGGFINCTNLTRVNIPNQVVGLNNSCFYGCSSLTSVTIPASVTSIGNNTFNGCTSLKSVEIPNSVTSIGQFAFSGCTNLMSVTIPEDITSIESSTFKDCTSLTSVTIPANVTRIWDFAFSGCTNLMSVTFADNASTWKIGNWGESVQVNDSQTNATNLTTKYCKEFWTKE